MLQTEKMATATLLIALIMFTEVVMRVAAYSNTYSSLTSIPTDIPAAETNVYLSRNQLSEINGGFDHLTQLETLVLTNNKFAQFPDLGAAVGSTLTVLYLTHNSITTVDPARIEPLKRLETLRMSKNLLTAFPNVTALGDTLVKLYLNGNSITTIDQALLAPLIQLTLLRLRDNKITILPEMDHQPALSSLYLSDNPIGSASCTSVQALNGVSDVRLDRTPLTHLPSATFNKTTKINLEGSSVNLCMCANTWIKKPEDTGMLVIEGMDPTCPGASTTWSQMTYEDLENLICPSTCSLGKSPPPQCTQLIFMTWMNDHFDLNIVYYVSDLCSEIFDAKVNTIHSVRSNTCTYIYCILY